MNKTTKEIVNLVLHAENNEIKVNDLPIDYTTTITYGDNNVKPVQVKGLLKTIFFSNHDEYLTFVIENEKGNIYVDYHMKDNYTEISWNFGFDEQLNDYVDKNTPVKVLREILKFITKYKYVGYYNGIDAVMQNGKSADEIVNDMKENIGNFHTPTENVEIDIYDINDKYHKFTKDGKYVVIYDVADIVENNAENEFIDIYEKIV